jgi:drug/metabolite transporter (DMT)-like permease
LKTLRLRQSRLTFKDWMALVLLGTVGVAISIGLYHMSIPYMQANAAAILFSANPVFVILFSPFLLKEHPSWRNLAAVGLCLLGIAFFFRHSGASLNSSTGVFLMLGAEITFALYTVLSKKFMPRFGAIVITCFAGWFGSIILLPCSLLLEGNPLPYLMHASWLGILYLAVFATALGYVAFFFGIVTVGASRGSLFFFLKPVLASIFAWMILGERLTSDLILGGALILTALVFVIWQPSMRMIPPE